MITIIYLLGALATMIYIITNDNHKERMFENPEKEAVTGCIVTIFWFLVIPTIIIYKPNILN